MSVAFDAKATSDTLGTGTGITSFTKLTVGSGANRALVVILAWDVDPGTVTVKWDSAGTNQTVTQISKFAGSAGYVGIYGLVAPTSGAKNLSCTWVNSVTDAYVSALSFTGANQTGGTTTFYNAHSQRNTQRQDNSSSQKFTG